MSRRKKIIIALSVLFIFGFFMFGATTYGSYDVTERSKLETNFEVFKTTNTNSSVDKVELESFSTKDYTENNKVIRASLFVYTNNPTVNIKVYDGTNILAKIYDGVLKIPLEQKSNPDVVSSDKKNNSLVTIQTINTNRPEGKKGGNEFYSYWIQISYTLPNDSQLLDRNAQISFLNIGQANKEITVQNYYLAEIKAEFVKPSPPPLVTTENRHLEVINNEISLSAKASYRSVQGIFYPDENGAGEEIEGNETIINGSRVTFQETGSSKIGEITKGQFQILATVNGVEDTLPTLPKDISSYENSLNFLKPDSSFGIGWYYAGVAIPYSPPWESPTNIKVRFKAWSGATEGKWIYLNIASIIQKTPPKIREMTLTNNTLKGFMQELKDGANRIFSDSDIGEKSEITAITNGIPTLKKLNVKDGDEVKIQFTIDNENLTENSGNLSVNYNGTEYNKNGTIRFLRNDGPRTTWEIDSLNYSSRTNDITFTVEGIAESLSLDLFTEPEVLPNTQVRPNSNSAGATLYLDYYNNKRIAIDTSMTTDAIAYMIVYDLDKSKSDLKNLSEADKYNKNELLVVRATNSNFIFPSDGEYKYAEVYSINRAGAIKEITDSTTNVYSSIVNKIKANTKGKTFYIDTIAPEVSSVGLEKVTDVYNELNSGIAKDIINGLISENRAYKEDDTVKVTANIIEFNLDTMQFIESDNTLVEIFKTIDEDTKTGTAYSKKGVAMDLTPNENNNITKVLKAQVYDKAGNETIVAGINAVYDDREPKVVETKDDIVGIVDKDTASPYSMKFTKNTNLPLIVVEDISFAPVSLAILGLNSSSEKYIGAINNVGSTNLISFAKISDPTNKLKPIKNGENNLEMDVYSHSGVKKPMPDKIVLDTEINYVNSNINDNSYTKDTNYNVINLNNLLDVVTELVGLKSFKVTKTGLGDKSLISDNGADKPLGTSISLNDYSNYNTSWLPTSYSNLSPSRKYELKIPKGVKGKLVYKIELEDRLGHKKIVNYTTIVSEETKIIGKTNGSSKEVVTKIKTGNNVKINSRTEGK